MKRNILLLITCLFVFVFNASSQTYQVPVTGNTLLAGTNFTLKDPGGNNTIPAGCTGSVNMCPTTPGQNVRINFTTLNLHNATITIYNGVTGSGTPLITINSSNQASVSNIVSTDVMGCLTLVFNNYTQTTNAGFVATVDEVIPYPSPAISATMVINSIAPYLTSQTLNYALTVNNQAGRGPLLGVAVTLALSANTVLDAGDSILRVYSRTFTPPVQAGQSSVINSSFTLPTNIAGGNYNIVVVVDYYTPAGNLAGIPYTTSLPITITPGAGDLLPTSFSTNTYGDTLVIGYATAGYLTLTNNGNLNVPSSKTVLFLSTDSIYDAGDFPLDTVAAGAINSLQNAYLTYSTINIPTSFAPGNYYLIAVADFQNTISESNELNNTMALSVLLVNPFYDLGINLTNTLPDTLYGHLNNTIKCQLFDLSRCPVSKTESVSFYISTDNVLDTFDIPILVEARIIAPTNSNLTYYTTIPDYIAGGNYYLIAKIDAANNYADINLQNNISVQPVYVVPMSFDLQIASATVPATVFTNPGVSQAIAISGVIKNNGLTNVTSVPIGIYFSYDSLLSVDDISVGSLSTSIARQGSSNFSSNYLNIPADTLRRYLIFAADPSNTIYEYDENNNQFAVPLRVVFNTYDITLTGMSPASLHSYVQSVVQVKVYFNNLTANSANSTVRGYISTDTTVASAVCNAFYPQSVTFRGNQPDSTQLNFAVPNVARGAYYLVLYADSGNLLSESNLNNNKSFIPISIDSAQNDISFASATVNPTSLFTGVSGTFSGQLRNTSSTNSQAAPTVLSIYASTDTIYQSGDILIGQQTIPTISANGLSSFNTSLAIPAGALGYNYILFKCNTTNTVLETNYNNNVVWRQVVISGPTYNLYPSNFALNTALPIYPTTTVSVSCNINNSGNSTVSYSSAKIYLSTDTVFQSGDPLLGTYTINSVVPGGYFTLSTYFYGINAIGNYYLLIKADAANAITETDETDNWTYLPITITAPNFDIALTQFTEGATQLPIATGLSNNITIANQANGFVDSFYVNLYLSSDSVYNNGDILVGTYFVGSSGVASGAALNINISALVPGGTPIGSYYLLAYADATNAYSETNELNNLGWQQVNVINSTFDMFPIASDSTYTFYLGNYYTSLPPIKICNFGVSPSPAYSVAFYLSADSVVDATDRLLNRTQFNSLAAMSYVSGTFSAGFSLSNVSAGNYYLIAYVDSQYHNNESNPGNNLRIWNAVIPAPAVDIAICNVTVPDTVYVGASVTISAYNGVCNLGTAASPSFQNQLLLSHNTIPDTSAVVLGSATASNLAAQSQGSFNVYATIPGNTIPGNYYILPFANSNYAGPDVDSTNNYVAHPVVVLPSSVDLLVDSAYISDTLQANTTPAFTFRVVNQGTLAISSYSCYLNIIVSSDSLVSSNDITVNYTNISSSIGGNSSSIITTTGNNLYNIAPGWYYILIYLNPSHYISETNYNNNVYAFRVYISAAKNDLGVSNFTINQQTTTPGSSENLLATITNYSIGSTSSPCNVKFYVSTDSVLNANATYIDTFQVSGMVGGSTYNNSVNAGINYTVPNLTPGRYYFICTVDETNINNDSNPANNHWAIPFVIIAPSIDLVALDVSVPHGYSMSTTVTTFKVGNNGNSASPTFTCNAYLSTDNVYSSNDYLVMTQTTSVPAQGVVTFTAALNNANAPAGIYYLIYKVNSTGSVTETNYNNNQMVKLISFIKDGATYLLPDSTYTSNLLASCNDSIIFNGNAPYNPLSQTTTYSVRSIYNGDLTFSSFALNNNSTLKIYDGSSTNAPLIGTYGAGNVPQNISSSGNSFTLQVSGAANAGYFSAYYNCNPPAVTDLSFDSASLSTDTLKAGTTFTGHLVLSNATASALTASVDYVLSSVPFDTLGDDNFGSFNAVFQTSTQLTKNDIVVVPSGLTDGHYYMLVILDRANLIAETNENNNVKVFDVVYSAISGIENVIPEKTFYYWQDQSAKTINIFCNNQVLYSSKLYDAIGREIQNRSQVTGSTSYQVMSDGVYFIEMMQEGKAYRYKVIVY